LSQKIDDLSIFAQLGMTTRQAEVYLAINELEQAKVMAIAKTVQTDRAEIYRAIPKLQKLGLIKKILTIPVSYKAVPLSEGLAILLQRNAEKHEEIQAKAKQFLENFDSKEKTTKKEDFQYTLTSGLKGVDREFLRHLRETKTSRDCILDWNGVLYIINTYFKEHQKALERGVKIRYITHIPKDEKLPQVSQTLKKTGFFEIRNTDTKLKAGIAIHDKKSFAIITSSSAEPREMEALWSNNPTVAKLAQDYFDLKWQSTKPSTRKPSK
jgi:sugar-specific transcriptional regulator TrmB